MERRFPKRHGWDRKLLMQKLDISVKNEICYYFQFQFRFQISILFQSGSSLTYDL